MGITTEEWPPSGSSSHAPNITYQHHPVPQLPHTTSISRTDHKIDLPGTFSALPYYHTDLKSILPHDWMGPLSFEYLPVLATSTLSHLPISQCPVMDPLNPVDLDEAAFVLTRPFNLQSSTAPATNGFPGLGLQHPSLQAPFDALSVSAIPSSIISLLYNPATQPLLTPSDTSSSALVAFCPWSHSTSPTPSLSPSPLHLTPSSSQPLPTLSTESLFSTLSHNSSRSHSPFSTTNEDTQSRSRSSWTSVPSHEIKSCSSLSSSLSPPPTSSSSSALTCSVCHKKYANNSTLRRHQKIHIYAKNESRLPASRLPPHPPTGLSPSSTLPFATDSSTSFAPLLGRPVLPTGETGVSTTERHTIQGYSPGSDPDIKKPECVGCGKAFARRDTVILHIKNQKRHWDEFVAMREQWMQEKKVPSGMLSNVNLSLGVSMPTSVSSGTHSEARKGGRGGRGGRPRKAADRYRKAEKLWHSTQQGQIHRRLRKSSPGSSLRTRYGWRPAKGAVEESDEMFEFELDDIDAIFAEDEGEEGKADDGDEAAEEGDEEGNTEMYDAKLVANMDAPQKFEWIMRAMKMPPCWNERKVRLFGAFGVLEESVLQ